MKYKVYFSHTYTFPPLLLQVPGKYCWKPLESYQSCLYCIFSKHLSARSAFDGLFEHCSHPFLLSKRNHFDLLFEFPSQLVSLGFFLENLYCCLLLRSRTQFQRKTHLLTHCLFSFICSLRSFDYQHLSKPFVVYRQEEFNLLLL